MAEPHDEAVLASRCDLQLVGDRLTVHYQGVVAGGLQRGGESSEHACALVVDSGCLAVHDFRSPDHLAAPCRTDGLVTEEDAKHGDSAGGGMTPAQKTCENATRLGGGAQSAGLVCGALQR